MDTGSIADPANDPGDGFIIATNRVKAAGENGDFLIGFDHGDDTLDFGAAFNLAGSYFSVINTAYNGANTENQHPEWTAGHAALIYSTADHTLYYDPNGAGNGSAAVATVQDGDNIQATDVVAHLGVRSRWNVAG